MRVLVHAHHLELGGSQTNSVDLAWAVREHHGMEVLLAASPGPAVALVERRGLAYAPLPPTSHHPSPSTMRVLDRLVRDWRPDLIHAWESGQIAESFFGPHLWRRVPLVGSNMQMAVLRSIPPSIPLTVGYPQLVAATSASRRGPVELIEPPVDVDADDPARVDPSSFVAEHGLDDGAVRVVVVSRLVDWMKAEGIARAIDAMARVPDACLVVVGEGGAAPMLADRAETANRRAGRRVATLVGALADPRPAYAAADIVLGMGGSALRGLAFAKPTVVLGELGFAELFTPESAPTFLEQGFYGIGGDPGPERLAGILGPLLDDAAARERLGSFGRSVVSERFGLTPTAARLARFYRDALDQHPSSVAQLEAGMRAVPSLLLDELPSSWRRRLRDPLGRRRGVTDPSDVHERRGRRAA